MFTLKLIFREWRGSARLTSLFIANLTVGLVGFLILDSFKRDFNQMLRSSSKAMMTTDLRVSARRPISTDEWQLINQSLPLPHQILQSTGLYSMVAAGDNSHLVELQGIEPGFPQYGFIHLQQRGRLEALTGTLVDSSDGFFTEPQAYIDRSVALQLDVGIGDTIKLGYLDYKVADIVIDESATGWVGSTIAPRIYIDRSTLPQTELIKKGTVAWYSYLIALPKVSVDQLEELERKLESVLEDPGLHIKTYLEAGRDEGRMLRYLNDYLGLVALTALALAGLGVGYLFQSYLAAKRSDIGILLSLGMVHRRVIQLFVAKLVIWGGIASLLAGLIGWMVLPLAGDIVGQLTPLPFQPSLGWPSLGLTVLIGSMYATLVCLPQLLQIRQMQASILFQEQIGEMKWWPMRQAAALVPALIGFYGLAVWQAHSVKVGTLFCLGLLGCLILIGVSGQLFIALTQGLQPRSLAVKLSLSYLRRKRMQAVMTFVSIAMGTLLVNLIPQLQMVLEQELSSPEGVRLPSLFLFDIQEDQIDKLQGEVTAMSTLRYSPMIRARLTAINGEEFKKQQESASTREQESEQRMRNRGVNLSYRDTLAPSETIVEGRLPHKTYQGDGVGEMTLEYRYAERLGIVVGDILTFSIQDIPIQGKIVGLRKVKWNSFDPNFFIQFQPGVLDDAPKTFVAAVGTLDSDSRLAMQKRLVKLFPNVSVVDVSLVIGKIMSIINKMSIVLMIMAILTISAGFIVLFSVAQHQAQLRRGDINLLKILGLSLTNIKTSIQIEFLIIAGSGAILGASFSLMMTYAVAYFVFDGSYKLGLVQAGGIAISVIILSLMIAAGASHRYLNAKPSFYLGTS